MAEGSFVGFGVLGASVLHDLQVSRGMTFWAVAFSLVRFSKATCRLMR